MTEREFFQEAVMDYMVNDNRVRRVSKRRRRRGAARRVLTAAACVLLIGALTVFTIPSARAAVVGWIESFFSARDYLGTESEKRTAEPQMDAVITEIANTNAVRLLTVYDSDEARSMAEHFGVRLDEVAYTGDTVYITGYFTGTAGKFLLDPRTGGDTWHDGNEFTSGDMQLTLPDGTVLFGALNAHFTPEMDQIVHDALGDVRAPADWVYDADGNFVTSNPKADELWYRYLESNDVRFVFEAPLAWQGAEPLAGEITAQLAFRQYYWDVKSESVVTLFSADLGTVTIDANAYDAVTTEAKIGAAVTLAGTHRMFIDEREERSQNTDANGLWTDVYHHYYVEDLAFDGVKVTVESVSFTPAGPELSVRLDLPESWPQAARISAAQGGEAGGIGLLVLLDGEAVQHPFLRIGNDVTQPDDPCLTSVRVFAESPIAPSEWEKIETLTFIPYLNRPGTMRVVEVDSERELVAATAMEPGVKITARVNTESAERSGWQTERLDEYAITVQLDDYR